MRTSTLTLVAVAACTFAVPAAAQVPNPDPAPQAAQDRGYDIDTPKHDAVDAQEKPVTNALNNAVNGGNEQLEYVHNKQQVFYEGEETVYAYQGSE